MVGGGSFKDFGEFSPLPIPGGFMIQFWLVHAAYFSKGLVVKNHSKKITTHPKPAIPLFNANYERNPDFLLPVGKG